MGSRYLDVTTSYQDIDSKARNAESADLDPLVDGKKYSVQASGWQSNGAPAPSDATIFLIISVAPPPNTERALKAATQLSIYQEPFIYSPERGKNCYAWSPYGETSLSIVEIA